LPKKTIDLQEVDLTPGLATGNTNPLPLDMLDLAYGFPTEQEQTPSEPVRTATESLAIVEMGVPPELEETPVAQLPDIADDPMLENAMRQTQLGLFVSPKHELL